MIVQIVIFKLKSPALRAVFLQLTERMATWLHQQPGFISYDLVEGEHAWSDRLVWQTREDEERGRILFFNTDIATQMLECVDPDFHSTTGTLHILGS